MPSSLPPQVRHRRDASRAEPSRLGGRSTTTRRHKPAPHVISALRAADGHTLSTLWKDVSDSASYLITSEWSDEQAFQDFSGSDAFRAVTNWGKEQIHSGRPQHKIYKH
jgi:heme-degrading monooxygenase HmoA